MGKAKFFDLSLERSLNRVPSKPGGVLGIDLMMPPKPDIFSRLLIAEYVNDTKTDTLRLSIQRIFNKIKSVGAVFIRLMMDRQSGFMAEAFRNG